MIERSDAYDDTFFRVNSSRDMLCNAKSQCIDHLRGKQSWEIFNIIFLKKTIHKILKDFLNESGYFFCFFFFLSYYVVAFP